MGHLVYLDDHQPGLRRVPESERMINRGQSLIPLQLALAEDDIARCFSLVASFGRCSVYPRKDPANKAAVLYLIRICDAIALNHHLLEAELEEQGATGNGARMDLIQMLENCEETLLSRAWDRTESIPPRVVPASQIESLQRIGQ